MTDDAPRSAEPFRAGTAASSPAAPPPPSRPEPGTITSTRLTRQFGPPPKRSVFARLRGILTDDVPLKILALVLAVTTWSMTRERLTQPETFDGVIVEVLDPPRGIAVRGVVPETVSVTFSGTRSEMEAIRAEFGTRRIGLRMPAIDVSALDGTTDPIYDLHRFDFPFKRADLVTGVKPPPKVVWAAVEERTVPVARPALVPLADPSIEPAGPVATDVQQVTLRGPARLVRAISSVALDPVDAREWLASKPDLAAPWSTSLGFDEWRRDDPLRSSALLQIEPKQVRATVKFKQTGLRTLSHALDLSVPADALSAMAGWEIVVTGREYDPVSQRMTLAVRSDKRTLDEMEQDPSSWSFAVRVPPPPGAGEPAVENRRVPVVLTFTPPPGAARPNAPPATIDGSPTVFLSLRRR